MTSWYNSNFAANLKDQAENLFAHDPTDASADPSELQIRNAYSFSNLRFTFPVTDPKTILRFPAYLRSFSDSFTPTWNAEKVYGRSDPIAIYQGTSRAISLSFAIPCFDSTDANYNIQKINRLIQNLYPMYKTMGNVKGKHEGNKVISGAPLTRIRFANLINNPNSPGSGLLGFITNLSFNVNPSNGFFIESGMATMGALFPRIVEFSLSFTPLHEFTVGWADNGTGNWLGESNDYPYITKARFGDLISATAGAVGLGQNIEFGKVFGVAGLFGD
jgi:hypothetical protein